MSSLELVPTRYAAGLNSAILPTPIVPLGVVHFLTATKFPNGFSLRRSAMTSSVDKAIKLAEDFGWRVFPANPKNKRPLISGWQDKAASDPEEINKLLPPQVVCTCITQPMVMSILAVQGRLARVSI